MREKLTSRHAGKKAMPFFDAGRMRHRLLIALRFEAWRFPTANNLRPITIRRLETAAAV
jgi:hypothetical protein